MSDWIGIEGAPKDGRTITVKRVHEGRVVYEGPAAWRTVHFGELRDPITGEQYADAGDITAWAYPDRDKLVPTPTHWKPATPDGADKEGGGTGPY